MVYIDVRERPVHLPCLQVPVEVEESAEHVSETPEDSK